MPEERSAPAPGPQTSVAIAATFTVEPLLQPLELVLDEGGLNPTLHLAPYHQLFQELLSPTSLLATHEGAANIVLIRLEDFVREVLEPRDALSLIERTSRELAAALLQFARRSRSPVLVLLLPVSALRAEPLGEALQAATARLREEIAACATLHPIDIAPIDARCGPERHDRLRDELAHIPYTEEYFAAIALVLARRIHALRVPAQKVLVLDCDNTLWRGVVGEDGVDGIVISEPYRQLQRFAVQAQAAGALICLTSKNLERDVLDVFQRRAEMQLRLNHIIAHRINWRSKAENIAELARELNLGLDSFVFLDDNPIECGQMHAQLPQVVTLQVPAEPQMEAFVQNLWTFDKAAVTREDTRRTHLYRENLARQASENAAGDIGDFIASLQLQIDIGAPDEDEWPRVAQLTQRTNQFNFTTRRRTEGDMRALIAEGTWIQRVRVRDRFGDYGLVGVMVARCVDTRLVIDTLLVSCRVLGRGVEHAMLRHLGELAQTHGLTALELPYLRTARNEPALAFADSVAGDHRTDEAAGTLYRIPVKEACEIRHRPGHDPEAIVQARKAEEAKGAKASAAAGVDTRRAERYARLANVLTSGTAVLEALRSRQRRTRPLRERMVQPASATERQLLTLWQELLNIEQLGVEDNYFALGGTSLLAARMFAEIARRFGVRLRLTTIVAAPTVRLLARALQVEKTTQVGEASSLLIELRAGGPTCLFLVHDGDGETLLYRNLAQRLPDALTVYGIVPRRLPGIPLAAGSIAEMARDYIAQMRGVQPAGPYRLGGLCAGAVIAFEMARQLQAAGERVALVALMDGACPGAAKRSGRITRQRAQRFEQMLASLRQAEGSRFRRAARVLTRSAGKLTGLLRWMVQSRLQRLAVRLRFARLQRRLARQRPWPTGARPLSVREIYDSAESQYVPQSLIGAGVVLLRAREGLGEANDTPYRLIYADETLGWRSVVPDLQVVDAAGGHSSMLQEPQVALLAASLAERLLPRVEHDPAPAIVGSSTP